MGCGGRKKDLAPAARHSGSRKIPAVSGWGLPQQVVSASEAITKQFGVLGGRGNGGSVEYAGSNAYYWSSTYYNTDIAYILNFNSGYVNPQNTGNKNNGFAVRCVQKSEEKRLKSGKVEGVKKLKS